MVGAVVVEKSAILEATRRGVRALAPHTASKRFENWVGVIVKKMMGYNGRETSKRVHCT
jgi:hypothetical protein